MKNTWILCLFPWIIKKNISVNVHKLYLQWERILVGNIVREFPISSYTVGISCKLIFWKKINSNHSEPFITKDNLLLILMWCEQGAE